MIEHETVPHSEKQYPLLDRSVYTALDPNFVTFIRLFQFHISL